MTSDIGHRIYQNFPRPSKELLELFRGLPASNIGDTMDRLYCTNASLKSINDVPLLGVAFTVKCPAGDNLMFHRAMDLAQPGDVLVIDAQGSMERALAGEMMANYAITKGIVGFVVDGCIRDLDALGCMKNFSVYCKGATPQGPFKFGPGEINVPVCIGGQAVLPGDILVGDKDGIVVIRPDDAAKIAEKAREKFEKEQAKLASYAKGIFNNDAHQKTYAELTPPEEFAYYQ